MPRFENQDVAIPFGQGTLRGILTSPATPTGVVAFAHGSGSGRLSPRNGYVASVLNDAGLATLLVDLLTADEERVDETTSHLRFDIDFLTERLRTAVAWIREADGMSGFSLGLFGASTGAAAALQLAAWKADEVDAVVSRGGRPDLALEWLPKVQAPTLLIVGGLDAAVIPLNQQARDALPGNRELAIVPGASHLFHERGALEQVASLATAWFVRHLAVTSDREPS